MIANIRHQLSCINPNFEIDGLVAIDSLLKIMPTMRRVKRLLRRSNLKARWETFVRCDQILQKSNRYYV